MSKISGLPELTEPAADDDVEIRDVSDTSTAATGKNKRITWLTMIAKMFGSRFGADAGASDTYVVTLVPAPAAYETGEHYRFKANTANTGACTVNFNGLGAKTIKKAAGGITTDLADNDIRAGQWVDLVYDGTNMQMQSLLGNAPAGGSGGIGDVVGPASATDLAIARYDGTTGKLLQDSAVTVDDNGGITVPEIAAPSTPAAGKVAVYAKADGKLYIKDDAGTETDLTATGAGGAEAGANSDITSMDGLNGALETPTRIDFAEGAAPGTPGAAKVSLYAKADGLLYSKDDAGAETLVSGGAGGGSIAPLVVESANVVAQRNGANAQTFNVYKTFTDASNYERIRIASDGSGNMLIVAEAAGTGTQRQLHLGYGATRRIAFDGTQLYPDSNNVIALGTSGNRFSAVRAVNVWAQTALLMEGAGGSSKLLDAGASNGGVVKFGSETTGGDGTWSGGVNTVNVGGSNVNNFDPTSIAHFQRWSSSAAIDVTGMTRFQVQGQTHTIVNVGSNNITLKHESASSTAGNRFLCSTGADIVLAANQAAFLIYDATSARWRVFKHN